MLNSAASSWASLDVEQGTDVHIDDGDLSGWRQWALTTQEHELERVLTDFAFIADVTTLASDCHFVGDAGTLVARYDGLPFTAVAFRSQDTTEHPRHISRTIAALTRRLVQPAEVFYCLVGKKQRSLIASAFRVLACHEEWQMLFRGDSSTLDPGGSVPLTNTDLPEMEALSEREGMIAFDQDPLARGPWYGVRRKGVLVAQGGTHLILDRAAEIGNIVTARSHRRRGYGSQIVSALTRDLLAQGRAVFLQVFKDNDAAIACYEKIGFEKLRTMYLLRCRLTVST